MRIAHVNFSDARDGISGSVRSLMEAQKKQGDAPILFSPLVTTPEADVRQLRPVCQEFATALRGFEQNNGIAGLSAELLLDLWRQPDFLAADIVHLHATTSNYFSLYLLPALAAKPLVWSIYEAHPFTAGCSHTVMCQRWKQANCNQCPMLAPELQARGEELFQLKKALYALTPFAAVAANAWLSEQLKASMLSDRYAGEVAPVVDPVFFQRANKLEVRQRLGIAAEAFVMACYLPGGLAQPLHGGERIMALLKEWRQPSRSVVLLQIGAAANEPDLPQPFARCLLPADLPPFQRSAVLQAADLLLHLSPHDASGIDILEAAAAGIPTLAFPVAAGSQIRHLETGYLTSSDSATDLLKAVEFLRQKPSLLQQLGAVAAKQSHARHRPDRTAMQYGKIYESVRQNGGRSWPKAVVAASVPDIPLKEANLQALWAKTEMKQRVAQAASQGTEAIWQELASCINGYPAERAKERGVFADLFLTHVLSQAKHPLSPGLLTDVIDQWLRHRQLPARCGDFEPAQKIALQAWTRILRHTLTQFFLATPPDFFGHLSKYQQGRLIDLWRGLFFNDFTTPYLEDAVHQEAKRQVEATTGTKRLYPDLLIRSMYSPFPPEAVKPNMAELLKKEMPLALQVILALWLVNVPYFDGNEKNQRVMLRNATAFLQDALRQQELLQQNIYHAVTIHLIAQFWRAAYLGGNLVKPISLLGDFLYHYVGKQYPDFMTPIAAAPLSEGRKLRLGYVSSNFCQQAVSFYMANRFFHADRQRFEIQVFALEKRSDSMTDRIRSYSDRFRVFNSEEMHRLAPIAQAIKEAELDILIYADIGMEHVSYQLAAMRLAPVQAVLVGHGATTGLPNADYYVSGDFEAANAQEHYRETLIRLPNLGAAQLPPSDPPTGRLGRSDFGLPADKVLLVSCANGIKHGPDRDALLVRILQQAPQAVIALKPFMTPDLVQPMWSRRVMEAAKRGGVADRLHIIPPLAYGRDLMDFLAMADIQLDSYPYGGWTTNMEAVYAGLAIVTQEGEQARSRWGAHILRALGVSAGIARTADEYVAQAVELVQNNALREQVRRQIRQNAQNTLFNGAAAQPAYEAALLQMHAAAVAKAEQAVQS